jgi:hypothetical protein
MTTEGKPQPDAVSFIWGVFVFALLVFLLIKVSEYSASPDEVCDSVSKGATWDKALERCVHIHKDTVSGEGIE